MHPRALFRVLGWALALGSGLASFAATAGLGGQECIFDATDTLPGGPFTNCTSNDFSVQSVTVTDVIEPCTGTSDTATISVDVLTSNTATGNAQRYDIGIWIGQSGNVPDANVSGGTCFREALFPADPNSNTWDLLGGLGPYPDVDGDACGDVNNNQTVLRTLVAGDIGSGSTPPAEFEVACTDTDSDGFVDVGWTISWDNNTAGTCTSVLDALPNNSAKCDSGRSQIPLRPTSDFGDAPASYGTAGPNAASNGVGVVHLGPAIDAEGDGQPSLNADGDDLNGSTPDDEDGVTIPALLTAGQQAIVSVDPTGNGVFSAWFDWNQDGVFSGADEAVFVNDPIVDFGQTQNFGFTVPATALPGTTYARFRYTAGTTGSPNSDSPIGPALEGEVEDYIVTVENNNRDYGDAPDSYGTTLANNGASNVISNVCGLSRTRYPDAEPDGQPTAGADGDDVNPGVPAAPTPDDEEGVLFGNPAPLVDPSLNPVTLTAGESPTLYLLLFGCGDGDPATTDAVLSAWIDWNRNGVFEAGEAVLTDEAVTNAPVGGAPVLTAYSVTVPPTALPGPSYIRVRLTNGPASTNSGSPTGPAGVGEVEDHPLEIANNNLDFGDAPASYGTLISDAGPAHVITTGLRLARDFVPPDPEQDGQPSNDADGDDTNDTSGTGAGSDENGVLSFSTTAGPGFPLEARVGGFIPVTPGTDPARDAMLCAYLDGAADGNVNGVFDRNVTYTGNPFATGTATAGAGNEEVCIRLIDPDSSSSTSSIGLAAASGFNGASADCTVEPLSGLFACTFRFNPDFTSTTTTYFRVRLTQDSAFFSNNSPSPTGVADSGEVEDYRIDIQPTAVTIGSVDIAAQAVTDLLAGLETGAMSDAELLDLLAAWDPSAAEALAGADRRAILDALRAYLDPDGDGQVAVLRWDTLEQHGTIGFYVDRRADGGDWVRVNGDMLPALMGAPLGGEYRLADPAARTGERYEYQLIEQEATGGTRTYGPFSLEVSR